MHELTSGASWLAIQGVGAGAAGEGEGSKVSGEPPEATGDCRSSCWSGCFFDDSRSFAGGWVEFGEDKGGR